MLANSQTTHPSCETGGGASSSEARKLAARARTAGSETLSVRAPLGVPSKQRRAATRGSAGDPLACAGPYTPVKNIVSRTSAAAATSISSHSLSGISSSQHALQFLAQSLRHERLLDIAASPQGKHLLHAALGAVGGH